MLENQALYERMKDLREKGFVGFENEAVECIILDCPDSETNDLIVQYAKENGLFERLEYRYTEDYMKENAFYLHTETDFREYNEFVEIAVFDMALKR